MTTANDAPAPASDALRPRVWAPEADQVDLVLASGPTPMTRDGEWFVSPVRLAHGDRYSFSVDGGERTPDPRSVWLPDGVHGATAAYDHAQFSWSASPPRPEDADVSSHAPVAGLRDAVIYELHIGTFTAAGTFDGAVERLGHLVDLGVTHIEVMPVCAFEGERGWGYDGVQPWSVTEAYGGPDGLKRLVDAAHGQGLGVILDVVHNHLGPSGNYLSRFGPYFTNAHHTPWGPALNLDQPYSDGVVNYLLDSARSWLLDFRLDGLRLDAVHELHDHRAQTFLEQLSALVAQLRETTGRPLLLIAESDRNDPRTVTPRSENGMGMDAQWDDDVHHSLHTLLTGEDTGYYTDFAQDPLTALNATLGTGFFHAGTYSSFRGRTHGKPAEPARLPAWRLVAFLQNHDQVGNRAAGDRLSASLSTDELAMAAAILVMLPFTPMLFMGEEWGASTPWQFFTGYTDEELARSVTEGRRREFAEHGWGESAVPDPQSQQTLRDSVLRWDETDRDSHASLLRWHRDLLQWRRERRQAGERPGLGEVSARTSDPGILTVAAPNAVLVAHRGSQPRALSVEEHQHMSLLELTWGDATLSGGVLSLEPGSCAMGRRA